MIDPTWLLVTAASALTPVILLWLVATALRNVSIIDAWWGPGFAAVAWTAAVLRGPPWPDRTEALLVVVTIWAARLAVYLTGRLWGAPEDYRYATMRERHGSRFARRSLFTVFLLQGALIWIISAPLQTAILAPGPAAWHWLDFIGLVSCAVGLFFETVGDWQLARFTADPDHRGRVLDTGLWRYTRHPNYFGDCLMWWGLFFLAASTPWGPWTVVSPIVMTVLLLRVSGVSLLEKTIIDRRPGYADYMARTSAFIPWAPGNTSGGRRRTPEAKGGG